ncbi:PEGA domain-containing protein [Archangium sp.]|uniref:PEGA domain-containing protein n=1 Tax=Archangium sp. TaxID=1872627 RepID=UPI002D3512C7|nr:PEGA domain-containing protein [Archangium sp.]HYO52036.1 PEGA domain-containing protein [Archangium sp.]
MDDLLAPLTPSSSGKKGKGKVTQRRTPKASKKGTKASKAGKGAKVPPPASDSEPESAQFQEAELLAPLVKKTELLVKMNGAVRGARLYLDDREVGPVPKGPLEVAPGEHVIAVRRSGYRDFSRRVTAKEGELTELGVLLEASAGFVSVKADVAGALVLINGDDMGVAPLENVMLPAGSYEIVVQREGFRPESQRIAVRAGKEYTVDVNLRPDALAASDQPRAPLLTPTASEPSPLTQEPPAVSTSSPLTSRWYFWAGVGAVVTAAAVGTVMATSQPLDPNKVCGGSCDGVINRPTSGVLRF